ncbi:hypothetical protein JCM14469_42890 [Desulfatiferula olefinivorans]
MKCPGYIIAVQLYLVVFSTFCIADLVSLSENDMRGFVAEEGVCFTQLPEACSTDAETEETLTMEVRALEKIPVDMGKRNSEMRLASELGPTKQDIVVSEHMANYHDEIDLTDITLEWMKFINPPKIDLSRYENVGALENK